MELAELVTETFLWRFKFKNCLIFPTLQLSVVYPNSFDYSGLNPIFEYLFTMLYYAKYLIVLFSTALDQQKHLLIEEAFFEILCLAKVKDPNKKLTLGKIIKNFVSVYTQMSILFSK